MRKASTQVARLRLLRNVEIQVPVQTLLRVWAGLRSRPSVGAALAVLTELPFRSLFHGATITDSTHFPPREQESCKR